MGRNWRIIVVALSVGILLSACTPSAPPAPTKETEPTAAQATAVQTEAASPAPVADPGTYPQPVQSFAALSPYPGPSEGANIYLDWTAVEEMILDGQVAKIYHAPTGHITLELKDGTLALALEPTPDDVFKVIERCGQACSDIEQVNE